MEPRYAEAYLREFARILKPGGALVFQMPSEPIPGLKGWVRRALATPLLQRGLNLYKRIRLRQDCAMEMYGIPVPRVRAILNEAGMDLVAESACTSAGPNWLSFRYLAQKTPVPSDLVAPPADADPVHA